MQRGPARMEEECEYERYREIFDKYSDEDAAHKINIICRLSSDEISRF